MILLTVPNTLISDPPPVVENDLNDVDGFHIVIFEFSTKSSLIGPKNCSILLRSKLIGYICPTS